MGSEMLSLEGIAVFCFLTPSQAKYNVYVLRTVLVLYCLSTPKILQTEKKLLGRQKVPLFSFFFLLERELIVKRTIKLIDCEFSSLSHVMSTTVFCAAIFFLYFHR